MLVAFRNFGKIIFKATVPGTYVPALEFPGLLRTLAERGNVFKMTHHLFKRRLTSGYGPSGPVPLD
jgi:hypothetical protein